MIENQDMTGDLHKESPFRSATRDMHLPEESALNLAQQVDLGDVVWEET